MTPHEHQQMIKQQIAGSYNSTTPQVSKEELEKSANDFFEKGGKRAAVGEIRTFGGRQYIRTTDGWKFHGKGTGKKAQEHSAATSKHSETESAKMKARQAKFKEIYDKVHKEHPGNHNEKTAEIARQMQAWERGDNIAPKFDGSDKDVMADLDDHNTNFDKTQSAKEQLAQLKEQAKGVKDLLDANLAHGQKFGLGPAGQAKVKQLATQLRDLLSQVELLENPTKPLTADDATINKILSNNGQGIHQRFFDATDRTTLLKIKDKINETTNRVAAEFQKKHGYGLFSDQNGGGPANAYHALDSIDQALKKQESKVEAGSEDLLGKLLNDISYRQQVLQSLSFKDKATVSTLIEGYKSLLQQRVKLSSKTYGNKSKQGSDANISNQMQSISNKIKTIINNTQ